MCIILNDVTRVFELPADSGLFPVQSSNLSQNSEDVQKFIKLKMRDAQKIITKHPSYSKSESGDSVVTGFNPVGISSDEEFRVKTSDDLSLSFFGHQRVGERTLPSCSQSFGLVKLPKEILVGIELNPGPNGQKTQAKRRPRRRFRGGNNINGNKNQTRNLHIPNIPSSLMPRDEIIVPIIGADTALSTNGSGLVVVTTLLNSLVTSLGAQWVDYSARWQQYRIEEMKITFSPRFPVNTGMALNLGHASIFCSDFLGTNLPTTVLHIKADENSRKYGSWYEWEYVVDMKRKPNALLWSPTTAAIPAANAYGIAIASSDLVNQLPVSIGIGQYFLSWKVHFMGYM